ncbi:hypothetical protein D3C71_1612000 [compost metagenome]
MIAGGGSQREEQAQFALLLGHVFKAPHAHHQLMTADLGVGDRAHHRIDQVNLLPQLLIDGAHARHPGLLGCFALGELTHRVSTGVGADPLAHLAGEDGNQLAVDGPGSVNLAQPPGLIKQAHQQAGGCPFKLVYLVGQIVALLLAQWAAQQAFYLGAWVNRQGGAEVPCLCLRADLNQ